MTVRKVKTYFRDIISLEIISRQMRVFILFHHMKSHAIAVILDKTMKIFRQSMCF